MKFRIGQSINKDISFTNSFRIVHFTNTQWHSVHKDIPDDQWIQRDIQFTNTFRIGQAIHKDIPYWLSNTQCYSVHKDIPYDQWIKNDILFTNTFRIGHLIQTESMCTHTFCIDQYIYDDPNIISETITTVLALYNN